MKYSEFVSKYALQAYLNYCTANKIKPEMDIKQTSIQKLCALVKPKIELNEKTTQTKPNTESTNE